MGRSMLKTAAALIAAIAAILLVVLLFLRDGPLSGLGEGAGSGEGLRCDMALDGPPSELEDWGPYSIYPISFPKVLGALLYFEEHRPALAPTKSQCVEMIPLLEEMGTAWAASIQLNEEMKRVLTPAQVRFVLDNKSELERPVNMGKIHEHLARLLGETVNPGRPASFQEFCQRRGDSGPRDPDYPRSSGAELITATDISSGVVLMEVEGGPELRLTPYQGAEMATLFERYFQHHMLVQRLFCGELLGILSLDQSEGLKEDIEKILSYKELIFETNEGTVRRDPLFDRVLEVCRRKL